ncbi:MAG: type III-A CRISPR-associated RAMP protein Csm4 [Chloroflexota bacterium]
MIAVDIHPRGAFFVGELGVGKEETLSYVPSDTLYAALISAWVAAGEPGPFVPAPLRVTSAFPRVGDLRLYPRPFVRINVAQSQRDELGKKLLKFEWCSERIFGLLLQGADMTSLAHEDNFCGGNWYHPQELAQLPALPYSKTFWKKGVVPHVALGRLDNAPNLFHTGRVIFAPGCGLWFGVECEADGAQERLDHALGYLADAGLGGLRSTGHGAFTFTSSETSLPLPTAPRERASGYAVTLSRYLPADADQAATTLKAPHAVYKLVHVGGWCQDDTGHPWRRKQVRPVCEGSVIFCQGGVPGEIVNVVPDGVGYFGERPVLRYGLAFPVLVAKEALL